PLRREASDAIEKGVVALDPVIRSKHYARAAVILRSATPDDRLIRHQDPAADICICNTPRYGAAVTYADPCSSHRPDAAVGHLAPRAGADPCRVAGLNTVYRALSDRRLFARADAYRVCETQVDEAVGDLRFGSENDAAPAVTSHFDVTHVDILTRAQRLRAGGEPIKGEMEVLERAVDRVLREDAGVPPARDR